MSQQTPDGDRTFAEVLSKAVQARGLSLDRIRARLEVAGVPVSNATLSYWQSGRSLPTRARSLRTLVELESILDLESGALIELIRNADGRSRHQIFPWQSVVPGEKVAEQIISELGIDYAGRITRLTCHDNVTIAEDRTEATQLTRLLLRAERSGTQAWPVVIQQDAAEQVVPEIEPVFGCTVGRVVVAPQEQLVVAEMLFPRPLQRGEVVLTECLITWAPTTKPSFRLVRGAPEPLRELALSVQFHTKSMPTSVTSFSSASIERQDVHNESAPVKVVDTGQVQHVWMDPAPGVYGLRWTWD
ncbi:hypothetical protein [Nigerium massiliense]|uniref:hypothetical protein n=1 Tax=Nigerium massiliense TaxID=1522317 RepID=UPI00058C2884|nr:hypothetical protein [Nigerium massiliense]